MQEFDWFFLPNYRSLKPMSCHPPNLFFLSCCIKYQYSKQFTMAHEVARHKVLHVRFDLGNATFRCQKTSKYQTYTLYPSLYYFEILLSSARYRQLLFAEKKKKFVWEEMFKTNSEIWKKESVKARCSAWGYNVSSRRTTLVTQSFLIVTFTIEKGSKIEEQDRAS